MNRAEKQDVVKELNETFKGNDSVLLINFTGLNVADSTDLRRKISEVECGYRVIKNRLALRALEDTSLEELKEHFQGPTAIAYTGGDPVALAKILKTFIQDHPAMSFKAGIVEGQAVSASEMENLAGLPSRIELLTKLVYLLNTPLTRLATALQSPVRELASVLHQLGEKKEPEQSAEPPAMEQPTPDPEATQQEAVPEETAAESETAEPQTTDQPEQAAEEPTAEAEATEEEAAQEEAPEVAAAEEAAEEPAPEAQATEQGAVEEEAEPQTTDQKTTD